MPKIKPTPIKAMAEIVENHIRAQGAILGCYTDRDFEARTGISKGTFCNRRADPRGWKLEQLIIIAMALKVPLSYLMTDHRGEVKE